MNPKSLIDCFAFLVTGFLFTSPSKTFLPFQWLLQIYLRYVQDNLAILICRITFSVISLFSTKPHSYVTFITGSPWFKTSNRSAGSSAVLSLKDRVGYAATGKSSFLTSLPFYMPLFLPNDHCQRIFLHLQSLDNLMWRNLYYTWIAWHQFCFTIHDETLPSWKPYCILFSFTAVLDVTLQILRIFWRGHFDGYQRAPFFGTIR